jgi:hypothetical protein
MLKATLTFFLLPILICQTFAQAYVPLLDNPSWLIEVSNFGGSQKTRIAPGIDVVIGSITYKKFIDPFTSTDVFLREDISSRRVYRRTTGQDELLYDFGMQINQNFTLSNGFTYKLQSITDVNVIGGIRRKFTLVNPLAAALVWIEGVGGNQHPLKPVHELPSDPALTLLCSAQGSIQFIILH